MRISYNFIIITNSWNIRSYIFVVVKMQHGEERRTVKNAQLTSSYTIPNTTASEICLIKQLMGKYQFYFVYTEIKELN